MTAPMSLRDYFAAAGSPFTKEQAAVIGPQLESMAEEGALDTRDEEAAKRTIVDVARSGNHPLHDQFIWDDQKAADLQRLDHAGKMLRSIRVRFVQDDRPRTVPAYRIAREQPKTAFARGHNVLRGDSATAVQKAREAMDELTSWRARYQPYVIVWKEFAGTFQTVANQIGEAEDVVRAATLDDRTDEALTDLQTILTACTAWQSKHAAGVATWTLLSEQTGFLVEAIDEAVAAFSREKPQSRPCLKCGKLFESGGLTNRLCERCGRR